MLQFVKYSYICSYYIYINLIFQKYYPNSLHNELRTENMILTQDWCYILQQLPIVHNYHQYPY